MQKQNIFNDSETTGRSAKKSSGSAAKKSSGSAAKKALSYAAKKSSGSAAKKALSNAVKKAPLRIVIFCDGDFPTARQPLEILKGAAGGKGIIIACDGTVVNLVKHRISPDFIVGDMDTLSTANSKKYSDIIIKNPDQETNDQTKSFEFAMGLIKQQILYDLTTSFEIYLLGTTGKREDHTLGNISLLADYSQKIKQFKEKIQDFKVASAVNAFTKAASAKALSLQTSSTQAVSSAAEQLLSSIFINICIVTDYGIFTPYLDSCTLSGKKGEQVSIFSFDSSVKIKSTGLLFPTDKVKFDLWWKATLNEFRGSSATLTLSHPAKILIYKPFI